MKKTGLYKQLEESNLDYYHTLNETDLVKMLDLSKKKLQEQKFSWDLTK